MLDDLAAMIGRENLTYATAVGVIRDNKFEASPLIYPPSDGQTAPPRRWWRRLACLLFLHDDERANFCRRCGAHTGPGTAVREEGKS